MQSIPNITDKVVEELNEFHQTRSDFSLVHFVIGRHGQEESSGPRMRYQCLRELRNAIGEVERMEIAQERARRKAERLRVDKANEDADLDIREAEIELRNLEYERKAKEREVQTLYQILEALPKYTLEDLQRAEPEYWLNRFRRQMTNSRNAKLLGVDEGTLTEAIAASGPELIPGVGRLEHVFIPDKGPLTSANTNQIEEQ